MINVHGLRRNVKNVVKNYTEAQIKVREATSNDPWGPSGTLMSEIADLTYNVVAFSEIMCVLWKRLNDHGKNWKHVYKALVLMEYLLKSGSEKVAQQCKERIFAIETLKDFQYIEENKDQGINVREKAKQLVALLKDDNRLKNERARALKARERFAQATAGIRRDYMEKDEYQPYSEEYLPQGMFVSELEQVRPQTIGEEELQLQLALAMSREEADQTERLKRNDELRLQMALSESKETFDQTMAAEAQPPAASAVNDLIDVFTPPEENKNTALQDPWGMPIQKYRYPHSYTLPSGLNTANDNMQQPNLMSINADNNNEANLNMTADSPDLLKSTKNLVDSPYDMAAMRKSLSADITARDFAAPQQNPSPQRFLGDNANLVNLDSLIELNRSPATLTSNPFEAARPTPPTINEIRTQNSAFMPSSTLPPANAYSTTNQNIASDMPSNNPFL